MKKQNTAHVPARPKGDRSNHTQGYEPKISLVIPAFNEEKYIGACLEHAIKGSRGRFHEIIVIDNASTDKTAEVVARYKDANVRLVHESKKGLTKARQRGYEEATGDVLAYVDADTHMPAHWYDRVYKEFKKSHKLACLSGPYFYHDIPSHKRLSVKIYWWFLGMPTYFITGYMVVGGNFAIRKNVLDKMGGFDTSIVFYGEDTNIARRAHDFGKVKFTLGLCMPTSGRRLKGQGTLKTARVYVVNFLSEVFFKKPHTTDYTDIR